MRGDEALSHWGDLHNHVVTQTAQCFLPIVCMPMRSIPLRQIPPWSLLSTWGAYSRDISIHRNNSRCSESCSTLKVPFRSVICPESASSRHSNLSSNLPCSNDMLTTHGSTRSGTLVHEQSSLCGNILLSRYYSRLAIHARRTTYFSADPPGTRLDLA